MNRLATRPAWTSESGPWSSGGDGGRLDLGLYFLGERRISSSSESSIGVSTDISFAAVEGSLYAFCAASLRGERLLVEIVGSGFDSSAVR